MHSPHSISQLTCVFVCQLTNALSIDNTNIIINWHICCQLTTQLSLMVLSIDNALTPFHLSIDMCFCMSIDKRVVNCQHDYHCQLTNSLSIDNTAIINRVVDWQRIDPIPSLNWYVFLYVNWQGICQLTMIIMLSIDNSFVNWHTKTHVNWEMKWGQCVVNRQHD